MTQGGGFLSRSIVNSIYVKSTVICGLGGDDMCAMFPALIRISRLAFSAEFYRIKSQSYTRSHDVHAHLLGVHSEKMKIKAFYGIAATPCFVSCLITTLGITENVHYQIWNSTSIIPK